MGAIIYMVGAAIILVFALKSYGRCGAALRWARAGPARRAPTLLPSSRGDDYGEPFGERARR